MVIQHRPTENVGSIELIQAWRQAGTNTVLWAQDMTSGRPLNLVSWGNALYLPVTDGMKLGIGIHNRSGTWLGYPTYLEAANLCVGGPAEPNNCTPNDMWELAPGQHMVMDALMNSDSQRGRPLIIVPNGEGMGIGEATFGGTTEFRGQVRVYQRTAASSFLPPIPQPRPYPSYPPSAEPLGPYRGDLEGLESTKGSGTFGAARTRGGTKGIVPNAPASYGPSVGTSHQVGIGAGAEEIRNFSYTGKSYRQDARLLAALQIESRADLAAVLREAQRPWNQWLWTPSGPLWFQNWGPSVPSAGSTAPHIPVAVPGPHQPYGANVRG